MFGHVNHTIPLTYFEEVRMDFLKSTGLMEKWKNSDEMPVVADMQCDYLQQIYFDEPLVVHIKAAKMGTVPPTLTYTT